MKTRFIHYRKTYSIVYTIGNAGYSHKFTYDDNGTLEKGTDPAGGSDNLTHEEIEIVNGDGYKVTGKTAEGLSTTYKVENFKTGDQRLQNTLPDLTNITTDIQTDGTRTITMPDGTIIKTVSGPDPRFSMQAPIVTSKTITTGGLTKSSTMSRVVELADPNNPLSLKKLTDSFTTNGKTTTRVFDNATNTFTETSPVGRQITTKVDDLGRVVQKTVPGFGAVDYNYDTKGRLESYTKGTGTGQRIFSFTYNSDGYLDNATNSLNNKKRFTYDLAGRIKFEIFPDSSQIAYSYDNQSNITEVTPPDRPVHNFSYTPVDLPENYIAPTVGSEVDQTTYSYNKDRKITKLTKPDTTEITYTYDSAGRLTSLNLPDSKTIGYSYNASDNSNGKKGQLASITASDNGTVSYSYNGALVMGEAWAGTVSGTIGKTYNNDFRMTSFIVNSNPAAISYVYDNDGLVTTAGDLTLKRDDASGMIKSTALSGTIKVNDILTYNDFGEPTTYIADKNGSELYKAAYTYDKLGRVILKDEAFNGGTKDTYVYRYNSVGRLIKVIKNGTDNASYTYDDNGNRLTGPGVTSGTSYDDQDRLLSYGGTLYTYTANGELKTKTTGTDTTTYVYDAFGNLTDVNLPDGKKIKYVIDGMNRRIGKKVGNELQGFLYLDGLRPAAELDGSGNIVSTFVYGSRNNVPDYMIKDTVNYRIISDHLGSPRLVVNTQTGEVVQRMDYDEFGNVIKNETISGFNQPFGFAGGLYDTDTGLTHFGAREYDAQTGRWTTRDPILFAGKSPNLYAYVLNDPINATDMLGLGPNWGMVGSGLWQTVSGFGGAVINTLLIVETGGLGAIWLGGGVINNLISFGVGLNNVVSGIVTPDKPPMLTPTQWAGQQLWNHYYDPVAASHIDSENYSAQVQYLGTQDYSQYTSPTSYYQNR